MVIDATRALSELALAKHSALTRMKNGQCQDFAAYRHLVGTIEGIEIAESLITKSGDTDDE